MKCYGLGLGLNTFKMVALTEHFRKLELPHLLNAYTRHAACAKLHSMQLGRKVMRLSRNMPTHANLTLCQIWAPSCCCAGLQSGSSCWTTMAHCCRSPAFRRSPARRWVSSASLAHRAQQCFELISTPVIRSDCSSSDPGLYDFGPWHAQVLDILCGLTADPKNEVYIISGRGKKDLGDWFSSVVRIQLQSCAPSPCISSLR
jgi:Trehalose-phosphatase